jgi:ribonuclease HI
MGRVLVLRTDGASRGNPGPAAAGLVIESLNGDEIACSKHYLGILTNNQAEYRALVMGLTEISHYRPEEILVYMDSELVVRQMNGQYRVKDESLRETYNEAQLLVRQLPKVTIQHVRRGQNARADRLANEALDEQAKRSQS